MGPKPNNQSNHNGIDGNNESSISGTFGQGAAQQNIQRPNSQNSTSFNSQHFNQNTMAGTSPNSANLAAISAQNTAGSSLSPSSWPQNRNNQHHQSMPLNQNNQSLTVNPILQQFQMQFASNSPQSNQQFVASGGMGLSNLQGQPGASIPMNNISQQGINTATSPASNNNSLVMPAWSGSINLADFAMSESEVAEVNRFRQQGSNSTAQSASNHTQSAQPGAVQTPDIAGQKQNTMDTPVTNTKVSQSNSSPAVVGGVSISASQQPIQQQNTGESNSLGLQNASIPGSFSGATGTTSEPPGSMNNGNLTFQQLQYLMMSGGNMQQQQQMIGGITPQQQLLIQQNMQRQALQQQNPQHQRPMMGNFPQASLQQQQHLQQYQQQQQHLQNIMMGGGGVGVSRNTTQQSLLSAANNSATAAANPNMMMRPPGLNNVQSGGGGNSFGFPNQAAMQQQQQMMALLNQQQQKIQHQQQQMLMQQGQRTQRIQTLNTFEGTSHAVFNDRNHFERHFANYVAQLVYPKGFEETTRLNGWPIICHRLGLDTSGQNQSLLHQYYQKCMLSLETNLKKEFATNSINYNNNLNSGQSSITSVSGLGSVKPKTDPIPPGATAASNAVGNSTSMAMSIDTPADSVNPVNTADEVFDSIVVDVKVEDSKEAEGDSAALCSASNWTSGVNKIPATVKEEPTPAKEEEEDKRKYHPKIRALKLSLGGIDNLRDFGQLASRYRPVKDIYAPRNYHLLDVCLRSGMPAHVRWGLDMMTCVSAELGIKFSECPEFFLAFIDFFKEQLEMTFGILSLESGMDGSGKKTSIDASSPAKQEHGSGGKGKAQASFKNYADLYESEFFSLWTLQPNTVSSLDPHSQVAQYSSACSLILRNCSFTPENQKSMSENPELISILIQCLSLPSSSPSYPKTLEHRKNALVCLSNLGELMAIPNASSADMILQVCIDFIEEANGIYRYTALCTIAKLLVNERNQKVFELAQNRISLVKALLDLFPWTGFHLPTASSVNCSSLAEYGFAMTLLTVLVTPDSGPTFLQDVLAICPDIDRIMFNLYKRPTAGPTRAIPSPEIAFQFAPMRERALRILFVLVKYFGQCDRYRHLAWEEKLLTALIEAMGSVDLTSISVLHEFLVAEYASNL